MKGLVYLGNKKIELKEIENPKIIDSKDAIVKVTLSSICTSDFHIINGAVPRAKENIVLGHEFVGEVIEVGSDVKKLNIGDRVSANCITFCGECYYCKNGFINNCEKGGWEIGCRINGCQAEYVRVPYADTSLNIIPENVSYSNALFVGDILASGYFGAELCEIKNNDTVAVIGSGPVGLCAMMSARIFGAKKIIAIDINENRLSIAKENNLADYTINPNKNNNIEEYVKDINNGRLADGTIEAAGGENTFDLAWRIARPNSVVALVAMYEKPQSLPLNIMYGKNLIFKTGGVDAVHSDEILKLISEGKINTDLLITHRVKLDDILKGYEIFDKKEDNCIKVAVENV
ncbi:alcohol dehydrogenase [uncultured Brachyspira sp.]|uniref:alcohol dehydrogenase n=1 Tax=uncultured Brachyspira sp. TaxID=221953 RepID=UPI002603410F|nr:alcohol dehydrogenase [uncultured Brachyspira sp.]